MRYALLLFFLLFPAAAFAQATYDLSCDNVSRIRIERHRDTVGNITSLGWYHTVHFELTPEAAQEFTRLCDATPKISMKYRDNRYLRVNIHIISQRHQLPLRASALTTYGDTGPTLISVRATSLRLAGNLVQAKAEAHRSLAVKPTPEALRELAAISTALGDNALAEKITDYLTFMVDWKLL